MISGLGTKRYARLKPKFGLRWLVRRLRRRPRDSKVDTSPAAEAFEAAPAEAKTDVRPSS